MSKKKKSSFSKEEKALIHDMKYQLSSMGVPREEWSKIIQQELTTQRKMKHSRNPLERTSKSTGFFGKIKNKIKGVFERFISKRMSKKLGLPDGMMENMEDFEKFMESMGGDLPQGPGSPFNAMMGGGLQFDEVDKMGKQGVFVADRQDKKKMVLDLEDDVEKDFSMEF